MCQVRAFYRSIATLLVFILVCSAVLEARYSAKPHWSVLSSEQEIQMGKENADEISKSLPLVTDPALNKYVSDLGKSLAAHAPGTKYPYTFRIVNQKEINAFALPGGPVFINLGTIQALDREEQLAGVMAHEISHVVMRHSANMVSKQMMLQFGAEVLDGMLDKNGSMLAKMTALASV